MFTLTQIEDAVWYAPDIGNNREKPEHERFAVQVAPMSAGEMRKLEEAKGGQVTRAKINFLERHNRIRAAILKRCIKAVRNLSVQTTKNGNTTTEKVDSVPFLIDTVAPESLLAELLDGLQDQSRLSDGIVGKFASPSASHIPTIQPGAGGAPGAAGESNQEPQSKGAGASGTATATATQTSRGTSPPNSVAAPGHN